MCHWTVLKIRKENLLYTQHIQSVLALLSADFPPRIVLYQ